ncbi:pre-rRNA-processing protein Ipi3p [Trichomonascus vanleenenianus]|uniref:chromatin-binding/pre-rRNA-processing protein IPI3 n=1 Tax=Trichomonascus vanleenenianus TaxID=2268995 RepID=UPI003ECB8F48
MLQEVLYYGSNTGKPVNDQRGTTEQIITAVDLFSSTPVAQYKRTTSPKSGIQITSSHIFALQNEQAQLLIFQLSKEASTQKIILPEKMSCLAVSPNQTYLAAGAQSGRLLIWELQSGNLLFEQDVHYQGISCLQFSEDESVLVTGGQDARVMAWSVLELVSMAREQSVRPIHSWTDSANAISDLRISFGTVQEARVYATSEQAIRCYDLRSGQLLTTFLVSNEISTIEIDPAERALYAGLIDGNIQVVNLYEFVAGGLLEAVGGGRRIITRVDDIEKSSLYGQHSGAVTAMSLSYDASLLVSGDAEGNVFVWELASKQVIKRPKKHTGPISHVATRVQKPQTYQEKQLASHTHQDLFPVLKRVNDHSARKAHDLWVRIQAPSIEETAISTPESILANVELVRSQAGQFMGENTQSGLQAKVQQLEGDLDTLYKHYNDLKDVHEQLWGLYVKK